MNQSEQALQMLKVLAAKKKSPGGVEALVKMLSTMDRDTEKHILDSLKSQNPSLYQEICEKYFTFEDLMAMDDKVLKRALSEVHRTTLAVALKGTPEELREKVFRNLSDRGAMLLKEDMELLGPKPKAVVQLAQREVTKVLKHWKDVIL